MQGDGARDLAYVERPALAGEQADDAEAAFVAERPVDCERLLGGHRRHAHSLTRNSHIFTVATG
jgi:hypothetical protein